jgi:hypothetical protein
VESNVLITLKPALHNNQSVKESGNESKITKIVRNNSKMPGRTWLQHWKNPRDFKEICSQHSLPHRRHKMKVTLNWLKQYVDFNWSPEELTGQLTLPGLDLHNRFTNRILLP